jgi:hypothetical protein
MRRGPLAVALALGAVARLAGAAPSSGAQSPGATGFDHRSHDRAIVVGGGDSLACSRCHALARGGQVVQPGHAACFGACHGARPRRGEPPGDRGELCTGCHADASGARGYGVHYPPYAIDRDFAITVGHKRHAAVACAVCHAAGKRSPHQRCAGCHDGSAAPGKGPTLASCGGCHPAAAGAPLPPMIIAGELPVTGTFSHARHAARGPAGARCTTCHGAVSDTDDNVLPAPGATTCRTAGCHDGTAGFAITASCSRCHLDPRVPGQKVARPDARYSHATHAAVGAPCASCHPLGKSGEVSVADHTPCVACHADDFERRQPRICGACHNATEPWRRLAPDRGPPERTEFGATLDHARHPGACTGCHALTTPARQLRMPRGHRSCTAAGCHAAATGPAPRLTDCEACHRQGLAGDREAARLAAPWSVRARFDHAVHAAATAANPPSCETCHRELGGPGLAALPAPAKASCAPCHDGAAAFKLTGTTCTRCHPGAPRQVRS